MELTEANFKTLSRLCYRYKLSFDVLEELINKGCEICGRDIRRQGNRARAQADHDHSCCKSGCFKCFRGFLCSSCNNGLGLFRDNPKLLTRAREYILSKEKEREKKD